MFLFLNLFYCRVDLQCCVNFCCIAKWFSYPLCCAQSHPTLCDLMDCSPQDSSVHGDSPGKNTEVGWHALLQGIFSTQESNPGLLHCFFIVWATRVYIYIYTHILFSYSFLLWFITGYWILFPVLHSRTLFIHSIYNNLCLLIPNSQSIPTHPQLPLPLVSHKSAYRTGPCWWHFWGEELVQMLLQI